MTITRRTLMTAAIGLALATTLGATAADAKIVSTEEALTPLVMGDPNAKVEVVEYASLSCPHCRSFHSEVYPTIKKEYIDTGKIRFEFVDFPTNSPGLAAAMIARCAGPERQAGMIELFFDTQPQWGRSDNPLQALTMVSRMAGLGPGDVDECLKNSDLLNGIQGKAKKAHENLGVNATPTLFINGEPFENFMDVEKVKAALDEAIKKAE